MRAVDRGRENAHDIESPRQMFQTSLYDPHARAYTDTSTQTVTTRARIRTARDLLAAVLVVPLHVPKNTISTDKSQPPTPFAPPPKSLPPQRTNQ